MNSHDIESLNLSHLDVDTLERRLEMSLMMHPFMYDCGTLTDKCNGKVTVVAAPE